MFFPCVKAYPLEAVPDFAGLLADYLWCDDEDETPQAAVNSGAEYCMGWDHTDAAWVYPSSYGHYGILWPF
jgi:hypothetical protein